MSAIRGRDTKPELIVRRLLHSLGYRYRLQGKGLPGRPDLVFRNRRKAIFVHGCFWHSHEGCRTARIPATRSDFWSAKFAANKERDCRNLEALEALEWDALVIWECEIENIDRLIPQLRRFLGSPRAEKQ